MANTCEEMAENNMERSDSSFSTAGSGGSEWGWELEDDNINNAEMFTKLVSRIVALEKKSLSNGKQMKEETTTAATAAAAVADLTTRVAALETESTRLSRGQNGIHIYT
jgi:hypothetical protein